MKHWSLILIIALVSSSRAQELIDEHLLELTVEVYSEKGKKLKNYELTAFDLNGEFLWKKQVSSKRFTMTIPKDERITFRVYKEGYHAKSFAVSTEGKFICRGIYKATAQTALKNKQVPLTNAMADLNSTKATIQYCKSAKGYRVKTALQ